MKKCLRYQSPFGCDPELFMVKNGYIVGSENIVKKEEHGVVKDGVQVELNPPAKVCREEIMGELRRCFQHLKSLATKSKTKVKNDVTVEVSKRHFKSLSEDSKKFGCAPSFNAHTGDAYVMELDPSEYLLRSAGGHIHMGRSSSAVRVTNIINDPERTIPIMDIIVGNTCVLLDRDEGNIERRKHYGQAGEYRTPEHGLEYRVLSNFWLKGTPLMSLVFGLARHALMITASDLDKELLKLVDMDDIVRAINDNDIQLAQQNFDKIKEFLVSTCDKSDSFFPINEKNLPMFQLLVDNGIDKYFNDDIISVWTTNMKYLGFNDFCSKVLKKESDASKN